MTTWNWVSKLNECGVIVVAAVAIIAIIAVVIDVTEPTMVILYFIAQLVHLIVGSKRAPPQHRRLCYKTMRQAKKGRPPCRRQENNYKH